MKNGLVLEGGAMRGLYTSGVTDVMMEHGITYDGIIGVSAGALFGCNYKSGQIGRVVRYNKRFCKDPHFGSLKSFFKTGDLYDVDFCYNRLPYELDVFDLETYRNNPMDFYVVCTDVETGKPVYHNCIEGTDEEIHWMRASGSMPIVSRVVELGGYRLLDGGIADSIPIKYFESIGYDHNVVILTQPKDFVKPPTSHLGLMKIALRKYPEVYKDLEMRHIQYNDTLKYIHEKEEKGEIFVIYPPAPLGIGSATKDPDELERVYQIGRKTGEEVMDGLKAFLNI